MQAIRLQKKYPQVTQEEMFDLINRFNRIETDTPGRVNQAHVLAAVQTSGDASYDEARETLKSVSVDASGKVELEDWVELMTKLRGPKGGHLLDTSKGKVTVRGSSANVSHTINQDELGEFTNHINGILAGDKDVGDRLPIPTNTMQLFDECTDGLILCKLINDSVPDTIDERVLNKPLASKTGGKPRPLNAFQTRENNTIVITSAKGIGCSVVNIGPTDIVEGREHLILGLIWQIIRKGLLSRVDIKIHPELYRLLEDGETLEEFLRLPPDQILLRWFNYHLKNAGWQRRVANFSKDVSDGENYTVLLNQLKPDECSRAPLQEQSLPQRAEMILQNADRIGCRKYLTPGSMISGNPRLNLAFVANLFNNWPGLAPLEEAEAPPPIEDFDAEGEREARVFTLWLNSLDVDPAVNNLFEDLKDGLAILQAFDKIIPGSVAWRRVSRKQPLSRFKAVENTNYAVDLAVANKMHIVGIQGSDIVDGKRTLVLGLVWQLMRLNIDRTLASLSKDGKGVTDSQILKWANDKVAAAGKTSRMRSFKDHSLSSALFLLDLLDAIKPGYVDYNLVHSPPKEYEESRLNAKLAISIARKMNCLIFLVPEDIVDVRGRLITTFVASLMTLG